MTYKPSKLRQFFWFMIRVHQYRPTSVHLGLQVSVRVELMICATHRKTCMVRVWVAGKTVWSYCYTRAISERLQR